MNTKSRVGRIEKNMAEIQAILEALEHRPPESLTDAELRKLQKYLCAGKTVPDLRAMSDAELLAYACAFGVEVA